jgi:hypothetical protein
MGTAVHEPVVSNLSRTACCLLFVTACVPPAQSWAQVSTPRSRSSGEPRFARPNASVRCDTPGREGVRRAPNERGLEVATM